MASFNPRKFSDPDRLRAIAPARLAAFLSPWRSYLAERDFHLPEGDGDAFDYAKLAQILMTPDRATPNDMVDALYYVHETADAQDMDELIVAVRAQGIAVADDPKSTPIDLAIDVWRAAPEIVRSRHAQTIAMRQQNFEYFGPRDPTKGAFPEIEASQRQQIQTALDDWFEAHKRGRECRLFVCNCSPR